MKMVYVRHVPPFIAAKATPTEATTIGGSVGAALAANLSICHLCKNVR